MIFSPLIHVVIASISGLAVSHYLFCKFQSFVINKKPLIIVFVFVAICSAIIPNMGQLFYYLGLDFTVIDAIQVASYFVFAVSLYFSWRLITNNNLKYFLLILLPISLTQPLLWVFALTTWSIGGFAP